MSLWVSVNDFFPPPLPWQPVVLEWKLLGHFGLSQHHPAPGANETAWWVNHSWTRLEKFQLCCKSRPVHNLFFCISHCSHYSSVILNKQQNLLSKCVILIPEYDRQKKLTVSSLAGYLGYTSGFSLSCMVFFLCAVSLSVSLAHQQILSRWLMSSWHIFHSVTFVSFLPSSLAGLSQYTKLRISFEGFKGDLSFKGLISNCHHCQSSGRSSSGVIFLVYSVTTY